MTEDLILVGELEGSPSAISVLVEPRITSDREAFAWALTASGALPAKALAPLNVDIKLAPITVLGALPRILPFRARLAALAEFELDCLDTLAWHARATMHAEAQYMGVSNGPARVAALARQVRAWRLLMLQDMTVMVTRGLLPAKKQAQLKVQAGYLEMSYLLLALVQVYRAEWAKLKGHTTLREHELDEAESSAEQLSFAFATRAERDKALRAANEQRQRNFTLLAHAYDQVRRGLQYLRWNEGDVDEIAPSLYRGRGGSRRQAKAEPASAPSNGTGELSTSRNAEKP
jgi:hypothetical protein